MWRESHRADPSGAVLADRHYNRQHPGSRQFVPPGRCFVLVAYTPATAVWVTSWPFEEYTKHAWAGAWVNSLFRREGGNLASEMIRAAVAATLWKWGNPPALGMITFVDETKIQNKRNAGYCYIKAGFKRAGRTKGGLLALQLLPEDMPDPVAPLGVLL